MKRFLSLLLVLLMTLTFAAAETTTDTVIGTVNGEELYYSDYYAIESAYLSLYESAGVDITDETIYTYIQDMALTYVIEQMLLTQDMVAQGCYNLDEETENWCLEQGRLSYEAALAEVEAMFIDSYEVAEDEALVYALAYAEELGVTEATYVEYYRTQFALVTYYDWLTQDNPVTDEDVQTAYAERVAESEALYANDVAAFETALNNNEEAWYSPAGYRYMLQILLPAEGETEEEKLASVQETIDDIYARLEKGESFVDLIREYGTDTNFDDESFLEQGYPVHQESIMWEDAFVAAAFSEQMAEPGCWSDPFVSDLGVHILYYRADAPSGPIALSDAVAEALAYSIYTERYTAAQAERLDMLAEEAEVIFY